MCRVIDKGPWPYVWRWGTCGGKYPETGKRKGRWCRVLARGAKNTVLVKFDDGYVATVSANGLKRRMPS